VLSTILSHARYDPGAGALRIRFRDGSVREYRGVPERVHYALLAAPSKGKCFHESIKGKYEPARVR